MTRWPAGIAGAVCLAVAIPACTDKHSSSGFGGHLLEASFSEDFRFGDETPDQLFVHISAMAIVGSGQLVVMDREERMVTVLDREGRGILRWGGKGEGPGEFASTLGHLAVSGHSTLAIDNATGVDMFTLDGELLRSQALGLGTLGDLAFDATGNPVVTLQSINVLALSDSTPYELMRTADGEVLWESEPLASFMAGGALTIFSPHVIMADLGGGRVAVGMSDEYDLRVLDTSTGREVDRITRHVGFRGPSERYQELWRQEMAGNPELPGDFAESIMFAERFPVLRHAFRGPPDGAVWIHRGAGIEDVIAHPPRDRPRGDDEPARPSLFDLFDADSFEYLGTIEMPLPDFVPLAGDAARIAGVHSDPLGVQSVRVLQVNIGELGAIRQQVGVSPSRANDNP